MENTYHTFHGNKRKFPTISTYTDKKAQDTVNFDEKLQKNACNIKVIALIYNKISLYKYLKKIQKTEGVMSC